jgi:multimeric flavodoxin WrbA
MNKKIAVLTGSPRKNGNSFAMTDAFIKAAEAKGHTITRYDTTDLTISGCTACETCYQSGKACSVDDAQNGDFNKLAPVIEEADAVVFTAPLYWYTFPAQLKAVIDKFFALYVGKRGVGNKECALMVCCAEDDVAVMDGIVFAYKHTIELMEWKSVGVVLIPSVHNPDDIHKTDGIAQAAALADKF